MLSAHVEVHRAVDLLAEGNRVGYLLKSRGTEADEFLDTVQRIAAGASIIDRALVRELVPPSGLWIRLASCPRGSARSLQLMAEGRSNAGVARPLRQAPAAGDDR